MATFQFKGVDELISQYKTLGDNARDCIGKAIYNGADVVADAIRAEINGLKVTNQHGKGDLTSTQKKGLIDSFGIAKMQDDNGYFNVKLGFDGYNNQKTKKYPNGQPNAVIARSINSGTSFRKKNPFVDKATKANKAKCEEVMSKTVDEEIERLGN